MRLPAPLAASLVAVSLAACSTVPHTGRSQVDWIPDSYEAEIGASAWADVMADPAVTVVTSGKAAAMVERIGANISRAAETTFPDIAGTYEWEFALIDQPETANAWALPGGKSAVYSGLLPITQDEDGLAIVMGHEVAHVLAHHGGERMTHNLLVGGGLLATDLLSQDMDPADRNLLLMSLGFVGQAGVVLPFSRTHESEADEIGLMLAADAGYDPRAAIGVWERMGSLGGERPPEWLSTHPSEQTRIDLLQELMPEALERYEAAKARGL